MAAESESGLAAVLLIASEISRESPPSGIGRAIANAGTSQTGQIRTNHEEEPLKQTYCLLKWFLFMIRAYLTCL
jgi:hypothetical protein